MKAGYLAVVGETRWKSEALSCLHTNELEDVLFHTVCNLSVPNHGPRIATTG